MLNIYAHLINLIQHFYVPHSLFWQLFRFAYVPHLIFAFAFLLCHKILFRSKEQGKKNMCTLVTSSVQPL